MINNSVSVGLRANQLLRRNTDDESDSLSRLATLKRIQRGSDDPSALIAAMELESQIQSIENARQSVENTNALLQVADGALNSASNLILQIKGDVLAAGNSTLSDEQRAALQLDVDAALEALDHLGQHSQYNGQVLFNGSPKTFLVGSDPSATATLSMNSVHSAALGDGTGTLNDLRSGGSSSLSSGDLSASMSIVNGAMSQVASQRVSIGSFQATTLDSSQAALDDEWVNSLSALSQIQDTDVANETSRLTQLRVLARASLLAVRASNERARLTSVLLDELV